MSDDSLNLDEYKNLRERLSSFTNQPPALLRARRRIDWVKTFALMGVFQGIMAAHIWYVWDPGAPSQQFMISVPVVLYGIALLFILGNRIKQIPEYRRRLAAAREKFPEHSNQLDSQRKESYSAELANFSERQRAEIILLEKAKVQSGKDLRWSVMVLIIVGILFAASITACVGIQGSFGSLFGVLAVILGLGMVLALFGVGEGLSTAIDDRIMLRHISRERLALRDMRRDITPEELTGALSAAAEGGEKRGGLSAVRGERGGLSGVDEG